jgi:hypothetical protein
MFSTFIGTDLPTDFLVIATYQYEKISCSNPDQEALFRQRRLSCRVVSCLCRAVICECVTIFLPCRFGVVSASCRYLWTSLPSFHLTWRLRHAANVICSKCSICACTRIYAHNSKCWQTGWVVIIMLRDFSPYGMRPMNVCVVMTVTMVMLITDFRPHVSCQSTNTILN